MGDGKERARAELERLYNVARSAVLSVNSTVGMEIWLRKAAMVVREAVIYDREGQLARAYVMYLRYIWVIVELRKHREYKAPEYQAELAAHNKKIGACMTRCETLKAILLETLAKELSQPPAAPERPTAALPPPATVAQQPFRRDSILYGGLRALSVPQNIVPMFLRVAESNTRRGIETCAVLCGSLAHDELWVTHLVVPKQRGTADTCVTFAEEELFLYLDTSNLLCLGWIHTHPTQTCFMSSVDLHTHVGYQLMLPEAIAIVCAPSYNTHAAFHLTRPHGIDYIMACQGSGFHKHPEQPPLYQVCNTRYCGWALTSLDKTKNALFAQTCGAHVRYTSAGGVIVQDLR